MRFIIGIAAGIIALASLPAMAAPNDPFYPLSWHHQQIGSEGAWAVATGSLAVKVAVVDTGVDATHPDLAGRVVSGWNFWNLNDDTSPFHYHGTTVAGVIAARRDNRRGVAGLADVSIMPVIVNPSPSLSDADAAIGIRWAVDHGAKVVNISAGLSQGIFFHEAAEYAWSRGALVVVATRNQDFIGNQPQWPDVITVSASNRQDQRHESEYGPGLDLLAPGLDIYTTYVVPGQEGEDVYARASGSSFAAPMVSAAAALAWSINPQLTNMQVRDILFSTADDLNTPGWDDETGWGRLNIEGVAHAAAATVPEPGVAWIVVSGMWLVRRRRA